MSTFEIVNVLMPSGDVYSQRRSISGDRPETEKFITSSLEQIRFDEGTCWYPQDAETVVQIRMSDTSDLGVIDVIGTDEIWSVAYHDGSLWTYTVEPGEDWSYHQDVLSLYPWVETNLP